METNVPSFPGHGNSSEELQVIMCAKEYVALPWPLVLNFVQL